MLPQFVGFVVKALSWMTLGRLIIIFRAILPAPYCLPIEVVMLKDQMKVETKNILTRRGKI
jgi:hypothetical protein